MCRGLIAVLVLLAVPAAAHADQRFAAPGGSGTGCSSGTPCDIATAINDAGAGDEVILAPGDYNAPNPLVSTVGIQVHGTDGAPRPRILGALSGNFDKMVLDLSGPGASVRHLEVSHMSAAPTNVVALSIDGVATNVVATSAADTGTGCVVLDDTLLTNSLCIATGQTSRAIYSYEPTGAPAANRSVIRNVTAISTAPNGVGIAFVAGSGADDDVNATVTNTIAHGDNGAAGNTGIEAAAPSAGSAIINVDHSHYYFRSQVNGANSQVVSNGGDIILSTMTFADGYHLPAGSPVIDAGSEDPLNGGLDLDGQARILGARVDMGADEFVPAPVATTGSAEPGTTIAQASGTVDPKRVETTYRFEYGTTTAYGSATPELSAGSGFGETPVAATLTGLSPGTTYHYRLVATSAGGISAGEDRTVTTSVQGPGGPGGGGGPGGADGQAPSFVGAIALSARAFAAAGSGASVAGRRRRAPVGTTVSFRVDEASRVTFRVQRRARGRRAGRRCVKPTRRNRGSRRCFRFVAVRGSFFVEASSGANSFRFSGRLNGRKLRRGRYRLVAIARDGAGNASAPRRVAFRIVRR